MISFEDVSFTYTNESYVLEDLSVEIPQGQFVCVLVQGSGKSTFSKLINALLLPDKGKVKVDGLITSDAQNTFSIRSKAGSVFQNPDDQIVASWSKTMWHSALRTLASPIQNCASALKRHLHKLA